MKLYLKLTFKLGYVGIKSEERNDNKRTEDKNDI